jgi:hypothetical protein
MRSELVHSRDISASQHALELTLSIFHPILCRIDYQTMADGEEATPSSLLDVVEYVMPRLHLPSLVALCLSSKEIAQCFSRLSDRQLQQLLLRAVKEHPYYGNAPARGAPHVYTAVKTHPSGYARRSANFQNLKAVNWLINQVCRQYGFQLAVSSLQCDYRSLDQAGLDNVAKRLDPAGALKETRGDQYLCDLLIGAGARFSYSNMLDAAHTEAPSCWLSSYASFGLPLPPSLPPLVAAVCAEEHKYRSSWKPSVDDDELLPADQLRALPSQQAVDLLRVTLSVSYVRQSLHRRQLANMDVQQSSVQWSAEQLQQLLTVAVSRPLQNQDTTISTLLQLPAAAELSNQNYEELLMMYLGPRFSDTHWPWHSPINLAELKHNHMFNHYADKVRSMLESWVPLTARATLNRIVRLQTNVVKQSLDSLEALCSTDPQWSASCSPPTSHCGSWRGICTQPIRCL